MAQKVHPYKCAESLPSYSQHTDASLIGIRYLRDALTVKTSSPLTLEPVLVGVPAVEEGEQPITLVAKGLRPPMRGV